MTRHSPIVVAAGMLAIIAAFAYKQLKHDSEPAASAAATSETRPARDLEAATPERTTISADSSEFADAMAPAPPPAPSRARTVEELIADTQSWDAKTRAAAIAALAEAPKDKAVPALERVIEVGEPEVDRQIALRSLHAMALADGDGDGTIRDVLRHAMYHSDNDGVTQSAQAFLEDIEAAIAERASGQY